VSRDPGVILITDLNRNARQTNAPYCLQSGNDMESLAIAGVHDFLARVPTVHQDINALALVCRQVFNHFRSQIVFALEGQAGMLV